MISALPLTLFNVAPAAQLTELQGLTANEASMANAIDIVCPQLVQRAPQLNAGQLQLQQTCTSMKQNANALLGNGGTQFTFGLNDQQLKDALGQLSDEKNTTPNTSATKADSGQAVLGNRLAALRAGAGGFAVTGFGFGVNGQVLDLAALSSGDTDKVRGQRGGAAGDLGFVPRFGGFINGVFSWGEIDETANQTGYDFDTAGVTAGLDYRLTDNAILGAAFNYSNQSADLNQGVLLAGGDVEADVFSGSIFGTYYVGDFYIDGIGTFSGVDYTIKREIIIPSSNPNADSVSAVATGEPGANGYAFSLGGGYDGRYQEWSYSPFVRVDYRQLDIDGYTESGADGLNLQVEGQDVNSLIFAVGGQIAYAISAPFGVVVPRFRAEYNHEFEDDPVVLRAQYFAPIDPSNNLTATGLTNPVFEARTDEPGRDFAVVGGGVSAVFQRNVQAFVDFESVVGRSKVTNNILTTGVRVEF
ncbi:MAG: autotransporter outer membrane beta-barrel domain-containing protein [Gammaproteobacteria bacterium]